MTIELNTGDDADVNEAIRDRLAGMPDVNFMTDAEKGKLAGIAAGATDDQSGTEIVQAIDAELGGNIWQGGGGGGGAVDVVSNVAADTLLGRVTAGSGDSEELTKAQAKGLLNIQAGEVTDTFEMIGFDAQGDPAAARPNVAAGKPVYWYDHGDRLPDNMQPGDAAEGVAGTMKYEVVTASFTATRAQAGTTFIVKSASTVVITIPLNATTAMPLGAFFNVIQRGAGAVQFVTAAGATINDIDAGTAATAGDGESMGILKDGADAWTATRLVS